MTKSYILLTYEGPATHVMISRNDFQTGLIDKKKLDCDPLHQISLEGFENVKLRSKIMNLEDNIKQLNKIINRIQYKLKTESTYHWSNGFSCKLPVYEEPRFTTDPHFITCEACKFRAEKELADQAIRLAHTPLI